MKKVNQFDVIVIGSGSAGFSAIEGAVEHGARACVIEEGKLGGECPNFACIPSKALLRAARAYREAGEARAYGLTPVSREFSWKGVMGYRGRVVEAMSGGGAQGDRYVEILKKLKVVHKPGKARFIDAHTLAVAGESLAARAFVIATGTIDFVPPIPGLRDIAYWGWRQALESVRLPKSLAIIGGGPVGCEIATLYASFGTRVILLQSQNAVLPREDQEISVLAKTALEALGVEVVVDAQVRECVNGQVGVTGLHITQGSATQTYAVEQVVVAAGKRPNVEGLGIEVVGVGLDKSGYIRTNRSQATTVGHIFAAGDVDGGMQFTHTAHHEGWAAGHNAGLKALGRREKPLQTDEAVVPRVTFLEPEVASVGMTESEAREKFKGALVGRYEVAMLGRAVTDNARTGLIKLVAHPKTRMLLGAHVICPHAGELIHEAALAIYLGATIDKIASMIHAFPTYAEGLKAAASSARIE